MCTGGEGVPGSAAEALALVEAGLDYLTGPGTGDVVAAELAGVLEALSRTSAKHAAAWNTFLARFDAGDCHDEDGYQSSASWLAGRTRTKLSAARGQVRQMRNLTARPVLGAAMAGGRLSPSWAGDIITWTRPLPADMRDGIDRILLDAAAAGAELEDLAILARAAVEQWKSQRPDPDDGPGPDDGFGDRRLMLDHTFGGAGRLSGDLTPECAAAVQAVLDALGKKRGPADTRTRPQRLHDALQEASELLIRAKMVPDRAGSDTRVDAVVSLSELLSLPGAGAVERAWLASGTGHHIYLTGTAAQAIACDALITPVVTGTADWTTITTIIELITDALTRTSHGTSTFHGTRTSTGSGSGTSSGSAQDRASRPKNPAHGGHDHAGPGRDHAGDRQDSSAEPDRSPDDHDRPGREENRPGDGQDASSGQDHSGDGRDRCGDDGAAPGNGSGQHGSGQHGGAGDLPAPGDSSERGDSSRHGGTGGHGSTGSTGSQATGTGQGWSEGRERLSDDDGGGNDDGGGDDGGGGGEDDGGGDDRRADGGGNGPPGQPGSWPPAQPAALTLTPQAWEALLHAVARLSVRFVSGPGGLASALRRTLLPYPCNSRSVPLDVGFSQSIPEPIRRAVQLRDRRCRWPGGCDRPPSACDVHHVKHKKDGGPTSVTDCLLLCQYHHDICIHRQGWEIELLAGGEVTARGPRGQLLPGHGHGQGPPPPAEAA